MCFEPGHNCLKRTPASFICLGQCLPFALLRRKSVQFLLRKIGSILVTDERVSDRVYCVANVIDARENIFREPIFPISGQLVLPCGQPSYSNETSSDRCKSNGDVFSNRYKFNKVHANSLEFDRSH